MSVSIRRIVRLSVLTPEGQADVSVAEDAPLAEIVRVVRSSITVDDERFPSAVGDDDGWCLAHPRTGLLDLNDCVRDIPDLADGMVLHLRARIAEDITPPVDDVAEQTRAIVGTPSAATSAIVCALVSVLLPCVGTLALMRQGAKANTSAAAMVVLLVCVAATWIVRVRPEVSRLLGPTILLAGAFSSGVLLHRAGAPWPHVVAAATTGMLMFGVVLLPSATGRWWRPVVVALGAVTSLVVSQVVAITLGADHPRAQAVGVVLVLALAMSATRVAIATSGLGSLDDRVAGHRQVSESAVGAAVQRASDDLTAMHVVVGLSVVAFAVPLAASGRAGLCLALATSAVVAVRGRGVVRPVHVLPLVTGGVVGAATSLVVAVATEQARAVPMLVLALVVVVAVGGSLAEKGVRPVTSSRLRQGADAVEKIGLVSAPLLLVWVFDLYRAVWSLL